MTVSRGGEWKKWEKCFSNAREHPLRRALFLPGWAFLNASGAIDGLFLVQRVPGLPQSTTCLAVRGGDAPLRSRRPASDGRASPPWRPPDPRPAALGGSPGSGSHRWDARGRRGGSSFRLILLAIQCANDLSNPVHPIPSDAAMARCAPRRVRARWEVRSAHPDRYARVNSHRHSDRLAPARYGRTAR